MTESLKVIDDQIFKGTQLQPKLELAIKEVAKPLQSVNVKQLNKLLQFFVLRFVIYCTQKKRLLIKVVAYKCISYARAKQYLTV